MPYEVNYTGWESQDADWNNLSADDVSGMSAEGDGVEVGGDLSSIFGTNLISEQAANARLNHLRNVARTTGAKLDPASAMAQNAAATGYVVDEDGNSHRLSQQDLRLIDEYQKIDAALQNFKTRDRGRRVETAARADATTALTEGADSAVQAARLGFAEDERKANIGFIETDRAMGRAPRQVSSRDSLAAVIANVRGSIPGSALSYGSQAGKDAIALGDKAADRATKLAAFRLELAGDWAANLAAARQSWWDKWGKSALTSLTSLGAAGLTAYGTYKAAQHIPIPGVGNPNAGVTNPTTDDD